VFAFVVMQGRLLLASDSHSDRLWQQSTEQLRGSDADHAGEVLWWSLALGAVLGGNATAIGASANVVVLGIAARAGQPIGFWEFTKYGLVVTAVTVALCAPYLWLRYL